MKTARFYPAFVAASMVTFALQAGPVTNWHTFKATPATTLSGQGTSSPVFGSAALPSTQGFLVGYFDPVSLTNLGDKITFSYQVTFTDAAGMSSAGDNFRYALFDLNGQTPVIAENSATAGVDGQTDDWRGYWAGNKGGGGPGNNGSLRERIAALASGDNIFAAASANAVTVPSIGSIGGFEILLQSATGSAGGPVYTGVMAVEKTPTGIALAGYLGGNGATNLVAVNDDSSPWPANFGAVAWLNGALNCDQVNLQNVTITYGYSNALQITSQPASITVVVGQPAEFRVAWTGSGLIPTLQWLENGIEVFGATSNTFTIPVTTADQNNNSYSVRISNAFGDSVTSTAATLHINSDFVPPRVLSVSSLVSNSLNVIFSEPVDPALAVDSQNYSLAGATFTAVEMLSSTNVRITLAAPITANYSMAVQNVKDVNGNTMVGTNLTGIAYGFQDSMGIGIFDGTAFALWDKIVGYANGDNIFNAADEFQYVYKPISGDFDVMARIESLDNTDLNARAGIMARIDNLISSRNVLMEATPGRFIFQYRTNSAEATLAVGSPRPPTAYPNCWVRLTRTGSILTGYSSTNYGVWTLIASHDTATGTEGAYPSDVLIGLAISSGDPAQITRAQLSAFETAYVVPPAPSLSIALAGSNIEVTWPFTSVGYTLKSTPSLTPPITWTSIPDSSTTNRVFVPMSGNTLFFQAVWE